jgi:hypothetical protein
VNHTPGNYSAHVRDIRDPSPLHRVQRIGSGQVRPAYMDEHPRSLISQERSRQAPRHKIDSYIVFDGNDRQNERKELYIVQNTPQEVYPDYKKNEKIPMVASPSRVAAENSVDQDYNNRNTDYSYLLPREDEISIRVKKLGNIFQQQQQNRSAEDPRTLLRRENRANKDAMESSPYSQGLGEKVVLPLPQLAQQYRLPKISSLERSREEPYQLPKIGSRPQDAHIIRRPEYYSRLPSHPSIPAS